MRCFVALVPGLLCLLAAVAPARSGDAGWIELAGDRGLEAWKQPRGSQWVVAGSAGLDPKNPKMLAYQPGSGVLVNGPSGRTGNIVSKQKFGDIEVHLEFMIPKGSNSGVKFEGLYEIQIFDSHGKKRPTASDCGGIYPRAEREPKYHHIDDGTPPRSNAARPAGEWQTLDVIFTAPRFDAFGKKIASARFVRVMLNKELIHENAEVKWPTGHAWHNKEIPAGPLLLQADHGPVAFRNIRVRPYRIEAKN
ncbi:MAG TPA: DUF1080 domain-containing protein [Gemmataceae bacterium]|nr:DUF1080 domain-containing protein [Gemmataceae bacterium]